MLVQKPFGDEDEAGVFSMPLPQGDFDELISVSRTKLYGLVNKILKEIQVQHEADLKAARGETSRHGEGRVSARTSNRRVESLEPTSPRGGSPTFVREKSATSLDALAAGAPDCEVSNTMKLADIWMKSKRTSRMNIKPQDRTRHAAGPYESDIFEHTSYRGHARAGKVSGFRELIANPSSSFNTTWRLAAIFLLCFDCLTVPMTAFDLPDDSTPMRTMLFVTVIFWTLDMPLSCVRGFINEAGDLEIRHKLVIKNYLRSQFLQDLLLIIIEWVNFIHVVSASETSGFRQTSVMRVLKFMRLLKITKASLLLSFLYRWLGSDLVLQMVSVPKVAAAILLLNHLMACGWHWISGEPGEFQDRYAVALHWTCSQMGFCWTNDQPTTFGERVYAIIVGVVSMMLLTVLIGAVVSEMARTQAKLKTQRDNEARMRSFMRHHRISFSLRNRIWTFLHKSTQKKKYINQRSVELIRTLPGAIHLELEAATYVPVLTHHPFFGTYAVSGVSSHAMRRLFEEHAVGEQSVVVEHYLFEDGMPSQRMYFLANGHLYYRATRGARTSGRNSARGSINLMFSHDTGVDASGKHNSMIEKESMTSKLTKRFKKREKKPRATFAMVQGGVNNMTIGSSRVVEVFPGGWLCEAALWLQWRHVGIAAAKNDCELITLEAETFQMVMHQELPEALEYAKHFYQYAKENESHFDDHFCKVERLEVMAKEVFEPPLFFNIVACQPAVDGSRSEWHPTDRKQWHVIWASPWKDGHKHNTSALISTLTQDMKHDAILFYQTMFAQNVPGALKVQLSQNETLLHDQRVLFLKRLILCLAVCRLRYTTDENGLTTRMWPFPLASALCHGSRILVHLSDVSWKSFINLLLFGEETGWAWEDGRPPPPFYQRRAATHGIRLDPGSSRLQETKLHGVNALGSSHLGLDLPLGGLGNPTPQSSNHGQLFVGPSGVPFRKAWMHKGASAYLKDVQHGHLYMRWDEIGDATAMSLALGQEPNAQSAGDGSDRFCTTRSTRSNRSIVRSTARQQRRSGGGVSLHGDGFKNEAYVWSSQLECWLPPDVFGGESWMEVPPVESSTNEEMRAVLGDKPEDSQLARLHKLWATEKEMSLERHADGRLRCRVLLVRLSISFRDGGGEKFLVQKSATAELCKSDWPDKDTPMAWNVDAACQPTMICLRQEAWKTTVERFLKDVMGLSEAALQCVLVACRLGEDPYMCSSEPPPTVCDHHKNCLPEGVEAVYDLLHLNACLQSKDRPLFEPLLAPGLVTKHRADIQGFGACEVRPADGIIAREWQWLPRRAAKERGLTLERPEDGCRLVLTNETKNVNSVLFGIESSAPLKQDFFGHTHSIDAVSKSVSAFGKRKWRDYRAGGQEVPADMGGMHVYVNPTKLKQLAEVIQSFPLCKPSDGCDEMSQEMELDLFQQLLQSSDVEAGDILEERLDLDRDAERSPERPEDEEAYETDVAM